MANNQEENDSPTAVQLILGFLGSLLFIFGVYRAIRCSRKNTFLHVLAAILCSPCYIAYTLAKGCVRGVYTNI